MINTIGKILVFLGFIGSIYGANWFITHIGICFGGHPPCLIPVWFGLLAPSGVLLIGLSLVLRDAIQELLGRKWVLLAVILGAAISALVSPALAIASGVAFLLGELVDFGVYSPLRRSHKPLAVLLSGVAGSVVDSAIFLFLAFGSLEYIMGNVVGKVEMTLLAAGAVWIYQYIRNRYTSVDVSHKS